MTRHGGAGELRDARQRRTRAALHQAALRLAATQDPASITVTALADAAGVHRSTVYEHGTTVLEILKGALAVELDELRERHLGDIPPGGASEAVAAVTYGVFEHADRYADIYRGLDSTTSASLHAFLSDHFQASTRLLIAKGVVVVPFAVDGVTPAGVTDAVVRYIADGAVGLIATWVGAPAPRDPATALAVFTRLVPGWFPGAHHEAGTGSTIPTGSTDPS